jgi:hypothetical protein
MKKVLMILLLISVCTLSGCKKGSSDNSSGSTDLENAMSLINVKDINEMAFCKKDPNGSLQGVWSLPQTAFAKTVQLMKEAKQDNSQVWEWTCVRIVTDKHKFVVSCQWDQDTVYFSLSSSQELRQYLKKLGCNEPGEPNGPIDFNQPIKSHLPMNRN